MHLVGAEALNVRRLGATSARELASRGDRWQAWGGNILSSP